MPHYVLHVSNTRYHNKNVKDYMKYNIKHPYYAAIEKNDRTLCVLSQCKPLFPLWLLSLTSTVSFAFHLWDSISSNLKMKSIEAEVVVFFFFSLTSYLLLYLK